MNNCEKLLRAFIEAQGFDIEEMQVSERVGEPVVCLDHPPTNLPEGHVWEFIGDGKYQIHNKKSIDYKVTKKDKLRIRDEIRADLHQIIREKYKR